jgi:hypothetical protein
VFEDDNNLKKLNQYEEIKIYASEYLSSIVNPEMTIETDETQ